MPPLEGPDGAPAIPVAIAGFRRVVHVMTLICCSPSLIFGEPRHLAPGRRGLLTAEGHSPAELGVVNYPMELAQGQ